MKSGMNVIVMMSFFALSSLALANPSTTANASAASHEQVISINDAFLPSGFDSSSDAFVIITGLMPNGCYHYKGATVTDVSTTVHEITATATVSGGMCPMVLLPYSRSVQLGKLSTGDHTIRFLNGDGTYWEKHLTVD